MRVAFISRSTLFSGKGGDTVQLVKTAEYLRRHGVTVDIFKSSDQIDYEAYDILHGFNVIRPADLVKHFERFKKIKVLSTIYVDYADFERKARGGYAGKVFHGIGPDRVEYLKTCARWIKNGERNFSLRYLLGGHRRAVKRLIGLSDLLLPNSESEYRRLLGSYGIEKPYAVIPNGIDPLIFKKEYDIAHKQSNLVICVARIDAIKNQLNLIRAVNNTPLELIVIGKPAPNHLSYYEQCRAEAGGNVRFVPELEQGELISYYLRAKVHAMPSWFETTGLSSLEAVAMGCNVVITPRGDTREYFNAHAFYCEPDDVQGIAKAIREAAQAGFDDDFRQRIYTHYTWQKTAETTLAAYHTVTGNKA